ncbi:hypothetical protein HanHA300_Chr06g0206481 [Helianthus annuus]|nr:hypothetical protein HanHA300_Chr06g0206481 [Helianthus annuus]
MRERERERERGGGGGGGGEKAHTPATDGNMPFPHRPSWWLKLLCNMRIFLSFSTYTSATIRLKSFVTKFGYDCIVRNC